MSELLTVTEITKMLSVSPWKIRKWLSDETIPKTAWKRMPGGKIRIKDDIILKIKRMEELKKNKIKTTPIKNKMSADEILRIIVGHEFLNCHDIDIPEFTFENWRIDLLKIDLKHKWVRGFEIKTERNGFLNDDKWTLYTKFVSSLTIVCQEGLIQPDEIHSPFGLLWISNKKSKNYKGEVIETPYPKWVKKAQRFQRRDSISWLWNYVAVLEAGLSKAVLKFEKR